MGVMWSRPGGLSLAEAWVTPATIALGVAVAIIGLAAGIAAVAYGAGRHWIWFVVGVISVGLAVAAGIVAVYGVRQRLLPASTRNGITTQRRQESSGSS